MAKGFDANRFSLGSLWGGLSEELARLISFLERVVTILIKMRLRYQLIEAQDRDEVRGKIY